MLHPTTDRIPRSRTAVPVRPIHLFAHLPIYLLLLLILAGCKDNRTVSLMGWWSGRFVAEDARTHPEADYRGRLQLFGGMTYKLHIENGPEIVEMSGRWKRNKDTIELACEKLEPKLPSEEDQQVYKFKVIPAEEMRKFFAKGLVLRLSEADKVATGLTSTLGEAEGSLRFEKRTRPPM